MRNKMEYLVYKYSISPNSCATVDLEWRQLGEREVIGRRGKGVWRNGRLEIHHYIY